MLVSIRFAWKEMCILSDQAKPRSSETFAKVVHRTASYGEKFWSKDKNNCKRTTQMTT